MLGFRKMWGVVAAPWNFKVMPKNTQKSARVLAKNVLKRFKFSRCALAYPMQIPPRCLPCNTAAGSLRSCISLHVWLASIEGKPGRAHQMFCLGCEALRR